MTTMIKLKTADLIGAALDWTVGIAVGDHITRMVGDHPHIIIKGQIAGRYRPSTDWSQGGPLLHKHKFAFEWIDSDWHGEPIERFVATGYDLKCEGWGVTHLVAACRAIVESYFGDEVEVPAELVQGGGQ